MHERLPWNRPLPRLAALAALALTVATLVAPSPLRAERILQTTTRPWTLGGGRNAGPPSAERRFETSQSPHPSVVRVIVPEKDGTSYGSGTLVDVHEKYALVVSNWHVVRDASETIEVVFPDGFRSPARALKVDRHWDLAALVIWRPSAEPVPLASHAPQPGDPLTIAGYGKGSYRAVTGRCTQYVAPGAKFPFEMLEVSVAARQGDSGGPIFNSAGELAGVLFGAGKQTTTGSYIGRVGTFLATLAPHLGSDRAAGVVASNDAPAGETPFRPIGPSTPPSLAAGPSTAPRAALAAAPRAPADVARHPIGGAEIAAADADGIDRAGAGGPPPLASLPTSSAEALPAPLTWRQFAGESLLEQIKTVLALLGLLAVLVCVTRLARE